MKKTLVLGASPKSYQYSHMAVKKLLAAGHPVVAIGRSAFDLDEVHVTSEKESFSEIDTVTMYLNSERQKEYEEYIIPSSVSASPVSCVTQPSFLCHSPESSVSASPVFCVNHSFFCVSQPSLLCQSFLLLCQPAHSSVSFSPVFCVTHPSLLCQPAQSSDTEDSAE